VQAVVDGELRLRAKQTIVMMSLDTMKSIRYRRNVAQSVALPLGAASPEVGTQDGASGGAACASEPPQAARGANT